MTVMGPLVGRRSQLRQIAAAADDGAPGLLIVGAAGVGKTRLAREAVVALDPRRFRAAQAVASGASRSIPFGALAHLLPSETTDPRPLNRLGWALEAIRDAGDGRRLVLSLDDAHLLDESSAAVVLQLARRNAAFLLVTTRSGESAPDAMLSLWKDGLLKRLELPALSMDDSAEMIRTELGGQVESRTVHRLWRVTEGNPLYLRELLQASRDGGTLVDHHGVFRWSGEVAMAPRLAELIGSRLGELDDEETAVLEYAAFGEPLEVSTLTELASPSAVDAVDARRLIAVESDAQAPQVRLAHPLYGEGIRARCPHLRARRRMRDLADLMEATGPRGRDDTLRLAVWRLETGTAHDPELMLAACRIAWSAGDGPLATRLGWAALNAGGGADAAVALATILNWQERFDEAAAAAAAGEECAESDTEHAQMAVARTFTVAYGHGQVDAALRLIEKTRQSLEEPVPRLALAAMRAEVLLTAGRGIDGITDLEAVLADPRLPAPVEAQALVMAGFGYAHAGRRTDALACLDREMSLIDQWRAEVPHEEPRCRQIRHLTHLLAGELDAAEAAVADMHRQGAEDWHWDFALGALGMSMAQTARLRGRVAEAERRGREAALTLSASAPTFTPCCLGELAHAEALAGDIASSRADLDEAERQRTPGFGMFNYWVDIARTWVLACGGDVSGAIDHTMKTASRAHDAGLVALVIVATHDAVRLGAADRASDQLQEAVSRAEGPFPAVCAEHVTALASGDGESLLAVADRFEELGMMLYAAEAAAQGATAFGDEGRAARSRAAGAKAWSLAAHCEGARTPALADLRAPALTPSEREVAHLAAAGLTSREIAGRLVRSVRTVDNHLAHAYDKLGVHSRRELTGLLTQRRDRDETRRPSGPVRDTRQAP